MSLIVKFDFSGSSANGNPGILGTVTVNRMESLTEKDLYRYEAVFTAPDWTDISGNCKKARVEFKCRYSSGVLNLVSAGIRALLKAYPELKSGRYGVPRNRIKCRRCGTVAWSKHRHDFTRCKCGAVATDGGYDYMSITGKRRDYEVLREPWQKQRRKHG